MFATVVLIGLSRSWASGEMEVMELETNKQLVRVYVEVSAFQRTPACLFVLILTIPHSYMAF